VCSSVLQCVAVCCSVWQRVAVCGSAHMNVAMSNIAYTDMGWLQWVGSLKLQVSFAKEPYKRDDILQKRPILWRSLPIVATPFAIHVWIREFCAQLHPHSHTNLSRIQILQWVLLYTQISDTSLNRCVLCTTAVALAFHPVTHTNFEQWVMSHTQMIDTRLNRCILGTTAPRQRIFMSHIRT